MLSSIGRAAIKRVGAASCHTSTSRIFQGFWHLQRVETSKNADIAPISHVYSSSRRTYATAATTTKTRAKKRSTTKPKTKTAAKRKPAKSAAKKKKVAAEPKPKKRPKKTLTAEDKEKAQLKELKTTMLSPPKNKPSSVWHLVLAETVSAKANGKATHKGEQKERLSSASKEAAMKYKSLTPQELEQYNHTANQNKAANEVAYKQWIESHTPEQIRLANNARAQLNRKTNATGGFKLNPLIDSRIPKQPRAAMIYFSQDRYSSGDFKGMKVPETAGLVSREWKALPNSERKTYEDLATADLRRYATEYKTVFRRNPHSLKKVAA